MSGVASRIRKVPGLQGVANELIGFGADIIQGGDVDADKTASRIAETIVGTGLQHGQRPLNRLYDRLERATGYGFGRPGLGEIINNPAEALGQFLGGRLKNQSSSTPDSGAWMPLLKKRPDPLWEIDWLCVIPGLPPEYIEDVTWTHPRLLEEGVFRNGKMLHIVSGVETPAITVTIYEDRLTTAQTWYNETFKSIFNEAEGTFQYPAQYKKEIHLVLRDVKQNAVGTVSFRGAFPMGSPTINNTSNGERVKVQLEFSVDSVIFTSALVANADETSTSIVQMIKDGISGGVSGFLKGAGIQSAVSAAKEQAASFMSSAIRSFSSKLF